MKLGLMTPIKDNVSSVLSSAHKLSVLYLCLLNLHMD
jgi:hypothetical protein